MPVGRPGWSPQLPDRILTFLMGSAYANWARAGLAGDASDRRFERLTGSDGRSVILMDTPPDGGEQLGQFLRIGRHLASIGLCPPETLLADESAGLLVIEDLGTMQFAQWLAFQPLDESRLYSSAIDVLVLVQNHAPPDGLAALTPAVAARMIAPLAEWYAPHVPLPTLITALESALSRHAPDAEHLALRDYHAENLIWRPDRSGTDRVGLLDFQDAVLAPPEYDLVSLLRDARRDVSAAICEAMTVRFADQTGRDPVQTRAAMACLGVQRNLRILGIFARLAVRDGKWRYLDLMPRVWAHVQHDLSHPALAELAPLINAQIPAPDAAFLAGFRTR